MLSNSNIIAISMLTLVLTPVIVGCIFMICHGIVLFALNKLFDL